MLSHTYKQEKQSVKQTALSLNRIIQIRVLQRVTVTTTLKTTINLLPAQTTAIKHCMILFRSTSS